MIDSADALTKFAAGSVSTALISSNWFIFIWAVVVYVRIVRLAFEWPWFLALLLLLGQFFALMLVISLLFGGAANPT